MHFFAILVFSRWCVGRGSQVPVPVLDGTVKS